MKYSELVKKYSSQRRAAVELGMSRGALRRKLEQEAMGEPVKAAAPNERSAPVGGISLKGVAVVAHKPSEGIKKNFYTLKKGMGYPVQMLAEQWHATQDTVTRHGKRLGCIRYVEVSPGEWQQCAIHPDTAKEMQ
jgi:hypothetical protein